MESLFVVFITTPREKAEEIANHLLQKRLAACVNIVSEVKSLYWWQGKLEKDPESLLIVKTLPEHWDTFLKAVKEVHPYSVPEILAIPVSRGNLDYLEWAKKECSK